jgi:hypothetical protein
VFIGDLVVKHVAELPGVNGPGGHVKLIFDSCLIFQKLRFNQINRLAKKKP